MERKGELLGTFIRWLVPMCELPSIPMDISGESSLSGHVVIPFWRVQGSSSDDDESSEPDPLT